MTVVIDASVLAAALVDSRKEGRWAETTIAANDSVAAELVLVETSNADRLPR